MNEQKTMNTWLGALVLYLVSLVVLPIIVIAIFNIFIILIFGAKSEIVSQIADQNHYSLIGIIIFSIDWVIGVWLGILIFKKLILTKYYIQDVAKLITLSSIYYICISVIMKIIHFYSGSLDWVTLLTSLLIVIFFYFLSRRILKNNDFETVAV